MKLKPGISDVRWMAAGAGLLAVAILVAWRFRASANAIEQLASKASKVDLVKGMSSPAVRVRGRTVTSNASDSRSARSLPQGDPSSLARRPIQ